jgi:hypothetical protein
VRGQLGAELAESAGADARCGGKRVRTVADHRVLAKGAQDHRTVRVAVPGVGGKQQLLLEPEVLAPVIGPVSEERVACLAGGRVGRAAKLLGDHQRMVVVTRERGERLGPLHGREAADVTRARPVLPAPWLPWPAVRAA